MPRFSATCKRAYPCAKSIDEIVRVSHRWRIPVADLLDCFACCPCSATLRLKSLGMTCHFADRSRGVLLGLYVCMCVCCTCIDVRSNCCQVSRQPYSDTTSISIIQRMNCSRLQRATAQTSEQGPTLHHHHHLLLLRPRVLASLLSTLPLPAQDELANRLSDTRIRLAAC